MRTYPTADNHRRFTNLDKKLKKSVENTILILRKRLSNIESGNPSLFYGMMRSRLKKRIAVTSLSHDSESRTMDDVTNTEVLVNRFASVGQAMMTVPSSEHCSVRFPARYV